jgi:hypothetical protein
MKYCNRCWFHDGDNCLVYEQEVEPGPEVCAEACSWYERGRTVHLSSNAATQLRRDERVRDIQRKNAERRARALWLPRVALSAVVGAVVTQLINSL